MSKGTKEKPANNPGPGVPVKVQGETATVAFGEKKG
jgi:hypothetical protein